MQKIKNNPLDSKNAAGQVDPPVDSFHEIPPIKKVNDETLIKKVNDETKVELRLKASEESNKVLMDKLENYEDIKEQLKDLTKMFLVAESRFKATGFAVTDLRVLQEELKNKYLAKYNLKVIE